MIFWYFGTVGVKRPLLSLGLTGCPKSKRNYTPTYVLSREFTVTLYAELAKSYIASAIGLLIDTIHFTVRLIETYEF